MEQMHNNSYRHFGRAIIRNPLNSVVRLGFLNVDQLSKSFMEGLYLASPEFHKKTLEIIQGTANDNDKKKVLETLKKYWIRSCTRCTPYGTFAGSSVVDIENGDTELILNKDDKIKKVRLDMNYLNSITYSFLGNDAVKKHVLWFPNNSIYYVGDELRYVESNIVNNIPKYSMSAIDITEYLSLILHSSSGGANLGSLVALLVEKFEVEEQEAIEYLDNLIEAQVITSDIEPKISPADPLLNIKTLSDTLRKTGFQYDILEDVIHILSLPDHSIEAYQEIGKKLLYLCPDLLPPKNTIQTDLFFNYKSRMISAKVIDNVIAHVEELMCLSTESDHPELSDFKRRFYDRYGDNEICLPFALDSDVGIGYGNMQDVDLGRNEIIEDLFTQGTRQKNPEMNFVQQFALSKYNEYVIDRTADIRITEDDLKAFAPFKKVDLLPDSLYILGSLFVDQQNIFQFDLAGVGGPSGANLLGRFSYGNLDLLNLAKEVIEEEENADNNKIYAEIIHLPESRLGNILLRPQFRKYEIAYLGSSGAPIENQIGINDLFVSIKNGKIELRSKKLKKTVVPRLTSAHNFHYRSLPLYKFLCDLQKQETSAPVLWDWGEMVRYKHLPRVTYKNIVVSKAVWIIDKKNIKGWSHLNDISKIAALQKYAGDNSIPGFVQYMEGDNHLLVDFKDESSVLILTKYINKFNTIRVAEFLQPDTNCIVKDVDGLPYTNELIIPIHKKNKTDRRLATRPLREKEVRRKFLIGSECLYIKVYAGPQTVDDLLVSTFYPLIKEAEALGLFDKFFFLRYKDDFNHLRIRFFSEDKVKLALLQAKFSEWINPLVDQKLIDKWVIDVYDRELERYFPELINETECLFYYDSLAVLDVLAVLKDQTDEKNRLLSGLMGVKALLNDFELSQELQYRLVKDCAERLYKEFGESKQLQKQLNDKYRNYRDEMIDALDDNLTSVEELRYVGEIFKMRSRSISPLVQVILKTTGDYYHLDDIGFLLSSYVHMFVNRLFLNQQRKWELLILHLLERHILSMQKRKLST